MNAPTTYEVRKGGSPTYQGADKRYALAAYERAREEARETGGVAVELVSADGSLTCRFPAQPVRRGVQSATFFAEGT